LELSASVGFIHKVSFEGLICQLMWRFVIICEPTEDLRHIIRLREVAFAAVSLQDKTRGALREVAYSIRDFRLPPRCKRDLRSFGVLGSVGW
jgi:hypothetical protein